MPRFDVELAPAAARDVKRLDPSTRWQLLRACVVLREAPYPSGSGRIRLLTGWKPPHFRLRIGDYRVIYRTDGARVVVVRVAHRREVYR